MTPIFQTKEIDSTVTSLTYFRQATAEEAARGIWVTDNKEVAERLKTAGFHATTYDSTRVRASLDQNIVFKKRVQLWRCSLEGPEEIVRELKNSIALLSCRMLFQNLPRLVKWRAKEYTKLGQLFQ